MQVISYQTPFHKHRDIADKYTGDLCSVYTLDGVKPAIISGRLNPHATVKTLDTTISMSVNWPTIERKMESDKLFYAC